MDSIKTILKNIRRTISRHKMITPGDQVVVAVSGGPDSVCLLDILNQLSVELEMKLFIAHYNHGLREMEDESETQLVRDLAGSMDIPLFTEKAIFLSKAIASLEERARNERYRFLERVRKRVHAQKIAIGHHLNDQVETVLMRLLRGSGPSGLAGIPPIRGNTIIRPLMEIKHEEIMNYLQVRDLPYAMDSSNNDTNFLRNKVRLKLIPELLTYQPRLIEHMGQLAAILREDHDYLERLASQITDRELKQGLHCEIAISASSLIKLPEPIRSRVIRQLLFKTGKSLRRIGYRHILSISEMAGSSRRQAMLNLPNGLVVEKTYDHLTFTPAKKETCISFNYQIDGPGSIHINPTNLIITIEEINADIDPRKNRSTQIAYLDADKVQYPLQARNFHPGDRFIPLGMKGQKKVKDFFIDRKVPRTVRTSTPILLSRDKVLWVCGFRIDERVKVTDQTKKILKVTTTSDPSN
jgi:tRNA(Ile)-lysidine synthase